MKTTRWLAISTAAVLIWGIASQALAEEDMAFAKKSGCLVCHHLERKVVGPAIKDIAARYKGDSTARAALVNKVKKGGKGNWTAVTRGLPMPPYSPRLTDSEIERLVDFFLNH